MPPILQGYCIHSRKVGCILDRYSVCHAATRNDMKESTCCSMGSTLPHMELPTCGTIVALFNILILCFGFHDLLLHYEFSNLMWLKLQKAGSIAFIAWILLSVFSIQINREFFLFAVFFIW